MAASNAYCSENCQGDRGQQQFGERVPGVRTAVAGVPYDAGRHSAAPVGNVTGTFIDAQNVVMTYTIDAVSGTNALTRVPF